MRVIATLLTILLALATYSISSNRLSASTNTEEIIRNGSGQKMGSIKSGKVYNASGQLLGFFDESGTYDGNRRKISMNKIPGILFCR
jgi:hypothetical protein